MCESNFLYLMKAVEDLQLMFKSRPAGSSAIVVSAALGARNAELSYWHTCVPAWLFAP
jgi:hypothetical protein